MRNFPFNSAADSDPHGLLSWCDCSRLFPSSGKLIWQTTLRSGICENINPYRWKAMRTLSNYCQYGGKRKRKDCWADFSTNDYRSLIPANCSFSIQCVIMQKQIFGIIDERRPAEAKCFMFLSCSCSYSMSFYWIYSSASRVKFK